MNDADKQKLHQVLRAYLTEALNAHRQSQRMPRYDVDLNARELAQHVMRIVANERA